MSIQELSLANERRAICAAERRVAQARRALEVFESRKPDPKHARHVWVWIEVLRVRVDQESASLGVLAAAMSPPMTKDRYAALLRRACQVAENYGSAAPEPDSAVVSPADDMTTSRATQADRSPRRPLTAGQKDILVKFGHTIRWQRPVDLGGSGWSSHSEVLGQLVQLGLVESKPRTSGSRKKLYRITVAGVHARYVPRVIGGGPLAQLIEAASRRHGGASDRQLARIAQQSGHKISPGTLSRLHYQQDAPVTGDSRGIAAPSSIRAIAFLAQVPEPVAYEAAGARTPDQIRQDTAAANRRYQRDYLKRVQEQTLPSAANQGRPWTRSDDQHMLTFMQSSGARIEIIAKELGRSHAGVRNRLRKLRSQVQ